LTLPFKDKLKVLKILTLVHETRRLHQTRLG
jgi:hypothetical protein